MSGDNGWSEWKQHVLAELARLDRTHGDDHGKIISALELVDQRMNELRVEVAMLKVKSGLWGLGGAAAAGGAMKLMGVEI